MMILNSHPRLVVFLSATLLSLSFSLAVYSDITTGTSYRIAEDGYDRLAFGLREYGIFSYYPNRSSTVLRGPLYPSFVAALLPFYPQSVQLTQAVVHGLTCLIAYTMCSILFDSRRAVIAGFICALHPYLIWYSSRIVTETLSTFLFTSIVYLLVATFKYHRPIHVALLGIGLGCASLCKGSFLPLVLVVPFTLWFGLKNKKIRTAFIVVGVALMIITPWTLRNYTLTGQIIPVHSLLGYNLRMGDVQAEFYERSPFSYVDLMKFKPLDFSSRGDTISHPWMRDTETIRALDADNELFSRSIERYTREPSFVVRKILFGSIMFWTLSSTPAATAFSAALQISLLILFIVALHRLRKNRQISSIHVTPIVLIATYFVGHIPIMAIARFSVVLIPVMVVYVVGGLVASRKVGQTDMQ